MKFGLNKDINRAPIKELRLDTLGDEKSKKEHREAVFKENQKKKKRRLVMKMI